ncbi:MAG: nucleotide sugar dehydrogenase [Verrucomicrobia bacterium]|nr:nucleotide sugar dehydrogenase [Verrucomicrobiota bacterium]
MIGFAGLSHLGLVYGLASAAKGFEVVGFDRDPALCARLSRGDFPVSEPGLDDLFSAHRARMNVTTDPADLSKCRVVFYSLDVPTDAANRSDLAPLRQLLEHTAPHLAPDATAVILSQVPPGFTRALPRLGGALHYQVETLVFGNAVERALRPERCIVGCADPRAPLPVDYAKWLGAFGCPVLPMRYESAELAKIAINFFLVSSVSTTNTLAELCERIGADWNEIVPALRLDARIGPKAYLAPGLGLAGGNLERDLVTVQALAAQHGTEAGLVSAWQRNSAYRRDWVLRLVHQRVLSRTPGARLALWGLAYKQNTRSTRNSPAVALAEALAPFVKTAFDPQVKSLGAPVANLSFAASALEACSGADALLVVTPWPEFSKVPPAEVKSALRGNVVVDPFAVLDSSACATAGLEHHRLGVRN